MVQSRLGHVHDELPCPVDRLDEYVVDAL